MSFSVVIPSKTWSNLRACVRSVRDAGETCPIIVADNGLASRAGGLRYIDYSGRFVFARAVNLGILAAGNDDILVLNDDALLETPHGFSMMHETLKANPGYGMLSAALSDVGNPNQLKDGGQAFPGMRPVIRDEPRMLCMVAALIPRLAIGIVGLLDQRFTAYGFEDDDYCLRIRQAGLKLGVFDGCFVDHSTLPSTFRRPGGGPYDLETGAQIFREKWGKENHEL
jgi:GT2 family glycosyltransferase